MEAIEHPPDLERLFRESAADLARYFARRHDRQETADDLVQETFLEFARGLEKGKRPRQIRAYLFGVARHVSHAAFRRRDRDRAIVEGIPVETVAQENPANERVAAAIALIETLPPLQREILDLRFQQGLSYAEIAEVLEIPVGTVRSRIHHAVALIRERISQEETDL